MQLTVPHIDGIDFADSALEQEIGEPAGGGTEIQRDLVVQLRMVGLDGGQEFVRSAADIRARFLDLEFSILGKKFAGLGHHPVGPETDLAGQDQPLRQAAAFAQPPGHQQHICPLFHVRT